MLAHSIAYVSVVHEKDAVKIMPFGISVADGSFGNAPLRLKEFALIDAISYPNEFTVDFDCTFTVALRVCIVTLMCRACGTKALNFIVCQVYFLHFFIGNILQGIIVTEVVGMIFSSQGSVCAFYLLVGGVARNAEE